AIGAFPVLEKNTACGLPATGAAMDCSPNAIMPGLDAAAAAGASAGAAQSAPTGPPTTPAPASHTVRSVPAAGERPSQMPRESAIAAMLPVVSRPPVARDTSCQERPAYVAVQWIEPSAS